MAAIQVNMRVPEVLLARINAAAGDERTKWILEACRMRLDGGVAQMVEQWSKTEQWSEMPMFDGSIPSPTTTGEPLGGDESPKLVLEGSIPSPAIKPDSQALRDICSGKVSITTDSSVADDVSEIPTCGKTWWEDGEHFECLMDAGHREAVVNRHGLRGMVKRLGD